MKMTGRPLPLTLTLNAVGVNAGAAGFATGGGADDEQAARARTRGRVFTPRSYHWSESANRSSASPSNAIVCGCTQLAS